MRTHATASSLFKQSAITLAILLALSPVAGAAEIGTNSDDLSVNVNTDNGVIGAFIVQNGTGGSQVETFRTELGFTTITSGTKSLSVNGTSGTTIVGGLRNNNDGITQAGAISGATTINASGNISAGTLVSSGNVSILSGGISVTGGISNSFGGIINAGAISGATSIAASGTISGATVSGTTLTDGVATLTGGDLSGVGTLGSTTINNSGATTTGALSVSNNANVGGNLSVTGASTLNGATTINNSLQVTGVTTTAGINNTGTLNQTGTSNLTGTTNINTSGSSATTIGSAGNASAVTLISGASTLSASNGTNTMSGTTNNIAGTTSINASVNSATSINTGTSSGTVTVGNSANTTNLNSATNNVGVSSAYATTNNIGTGNAFASSNTIGNTNSGTTVTEHGGNSTMSLANNNASLSVASGGSYTANTTQAQTAFGANTLTVDAAHINGTVGGGSFNVTNASASIGNVGGGSYTSTAAPYVIGTSGPALVAGDAASRANVLGASYVNRLQGNTLVDGNMYINGTLVYTSNTSASTSVTSGTSILGDATQATNGQMTIVNIGGTGATIDQNGKVTTGIVSQSTASLTLTNGVGDTHGLVVTETQATLSGGTRSSSLTLDDNGARFSNSANGAPVKVTGVADGTNDFDAVNFRQLKGVAAGVAGTSAMANIPQVDQNKTFAVGVGLGNFQGLTALAFGASYRAAENAVVRVSASTVGGVRKSTVVGAGVGFSW